ncbi:MAG: methyl-accepting chemotaxis protein [Clostridium sp.]|nr:methyl-accepting chemotaxis protein [Clostridium sp.]
MSNILKKFEELIPYLSVIFEDEASFAITDTEKYLSVYLSKKLPLNIKEGDKIPHDGAVYQALSNKKNVIREVGKEVYGIPFKSYAIPIFDDERKIVGVFVLGKSLEKSKEMINLSENLTKSIEQIYEAVQKITSKIQTISNDNENIVNEVDNAITNVNGSNEILKIIRGVSNQTNLLGLNAAIESARAGEYGKGFSVVAGEIRKLSSSSSESVGKIEEILSSIRKSVDSISSRINNVNKSIESGAETMEEINASIEEVASAAQHLEEFAKNN